MSLQSTAGCFFLDTSVVLCDVFSEDMRTCRINKFKKDVEIHGVSCFACESVKNEAYDKVQEAANFVGDVIRDTIGIQLTEVRKNRNLDLSAPIDSEDVRVLEELFSGLHNAVQRYVSDGFLLPSAVTSIEEWAIACLGKARDISQFLAELVTHLLKITSSYEDLYDDLLVHENGYIKVRGRMDPLIKFRLETRAHIHAPDSDHLSSAIAHQNTEHETAVFVTFDYRSILSEREVLRRQFGIQCSDPLYAIYHLV